MAITMFQALGGLINITIDVLRVCGKTPVFPQTLTVNKLKADSF